MEMEKLLDKELENIPIFKKIEDVVETTNAHLTDSIYIWDGAFLPDKKDIGRCYRPDFSLKTNKEVNELIKNKKGTFLSPEYENADFFVYNERTNELVPFKENDILIYGNGNGYFKLIGKEYIYYDDNGIEIGRGSYAEDEESKTESKHPKPKKAKKKHS